MSEPTARELTEATAALAGVARETPVLESAALNRALGVRALVKAECLQVTGSFKLRGAYVRLTRLSEAERKAGVVAFSSGNFAQGLAAAGALLGVPVTIVMPGDAPAAKVEATRGYGATVVPSEHGSRNRELAAAELARHVAAETGARLLHPFDDPVIAIGQATATAEMVRQVVRLGARLDAVLVPVGGGGLLAGAVLAAGDEEGAPEIIAVEPEGYDDWGRSLVAGVRLANAESPATLCDALQAATPGEVPFGIAAGRVRRSLAVGDAEICEAMALAFRHLKIVVEPSGAVGLAALVTRRLGLEGRTVGVIASGGNIALERFAELTLQGR